MTQDDVIREPEGWAVSTLGATAHLVKEKIDPSSVPSETPYVGLEHVEAHSMKLLGHGCSSDVKSTKTRFKAGDVLYGKLRPYLNKVARPDFDGICSTDFLVFSESPELDRGYLAHYLNQLWVADRAHQISNGVELPRVDWKSLSNFPISYPIEKAIQQDIVGAIERSAALRTSSAVHLTAARRAIERVRQAVLAAACSGRLTADWRLHHEPTESAAHFQKRLLELHQAIRKKQPLTPFLDPELPDIPDEWQWSSADSLTSLITKGTTPSPSNMSQGDGEIPFLKVYNLTFNGRVDFTINPTFIPRSIHVGPLRRSRVYPGDLLLNIVGPPLGKVAIVPNSYREWNINQAIAVFRPIKGIDIDFLKLWLLSPSLLSHLARRAKATAGQYNLTLEICRELPIPTPLPDEQVEIVHRADQLLSTVDRLHGRIAIVSRQVERSSQAVLAKAFRREMLAGAADDR